jgi:hypothetical protein
MSRKLEIRQRMAELQREFSSLNAEMKEIESIEKGAVALERYKDYQFKVGVYGYTLESEDKIVEATDEDRERSSTGKSGLVYTGYERDFGFIMLKTREEYPRVVRVYKILEAVNALADETVKDKEPHIKVILGEETK